MKVHQSELMLLFKTQIKTTYSLSISSAQLPTFTSFSLSIKWANIAAIAKQWAEAVPDPSPTVPYVSDESEEEEESLSDGSTDSDKLEDSNNPVM